MSRSARSGLGRTVIVAAIAAAECAAIGRNGTIDRAGAIPRPNVLVILTGDLGWSDIQPYGGEIEPLVLQSLAAVRRGRAETPRAVEHLAPSIEFNTALHRDFAR